MALPRQAGREGGMTDIVIVGGGSAGCVLANRLSADPARNVTLIEAGADYPDFEAAPGAVRRAVGGVDVMEQFGALDWGFTGLGSARGGSIAVPRGKVMGGSGAINGCIWLRGLPEDFGRWEQMVGPGWSWQDLLPAYRAIEADPAGSSSDHGRDGPFPIYRYPAATWTATQAAFHAACRELGYGETEDENAPDSMGVGQLPLNQLDGLRWGPARALLTAEVRARPNLTIRAQTRARRISFSGSRATRVHIDGPAGHEILDAGEIILAAGAVASPHLLLLSGIGPRDELRSHGIDVVVDVPGVGRGVRDHPKTWVAWHVREGVAGALDDPLLQLSARYTASGSDLRGDMMLYPNSVVPGAEPGGRDFRIEAVNNLQLSWGQLSLRSADPGDHPVIDLRLLSEARDRERLVDAIERSLTLAETGPLREVLGDLVLPDRAALRDRSALADYVDRTVMTGQHISSSCRMGRDADELAVVGPDCRVRGTSGLRVIDGSVMPDSVRANTHATILAIAQLMAGRIAAGD